MIATINGRKAYIDIQKVSSIVFEPKRDECNPDRIFISLHGSQMTTVIECANKEEAFNIIQLIEDNKKEVTLIKEIDIFKEALEYAIKIVKG